MNMIMTWGMLIGWMMCLKL
jgi:hypothetical protein